MNVWRKMATCVLGAALPSLVHATFIDSMGRLWREPRDTVGYSYNQVVADSSNGCDPTSGRCRGLLGATGPSVEGWTWASESAVRGLFGEIGIPEFNSSPGGPLSYSEIDSPWLPPIVNGANSLPGLFEPNFFDPFFITDRLGVGGLTRTTALFFGETRVRTAVVWRDVITMEQLLYDPGLDIFFPIIVTQIQDTASTEGLDFLDFPNGSPGFGEVGGLWMYQGATAASSPGGLPLVGLGLLLLWLRARREGE